MKFFSVAAVLSALPLLASAANQTILVGNNGSLTYEPNSVNASVGDTLTFMFMAKNHTLTQSSFATPCANLSADGIDSGFQPVTANSSTVPSFSFSVTNASAPMWFYCRQTGHCEEGMVFAVNPTAAKSFSAFQAAANASSSTTSAANSTSSGKASSKTSTATGSGPSSSSTTASGTANGAMSHGVHAGALLAGLGVVAGMLL